MKVVNSAHNHSAEILQIYFYDDQQQLVSIAKNGAIFVWDTHEMKVLQTFKEDHGIRYSILDPKNKGTIYTTNQFIKQYNAKIVPELELKALQVKTLAKDFQNEMKGKDMTKTLSRKKTLLYDESKIKESKNSNVLVTDNSSLVFVSFLESHNFIVTIDSKNLVRLWDLDTGESHSSYNVEITSTVTAANIDKTNGLLAIGND